MKNETIAALLVVAILVSAGAGYLVGYSNQRTTTSTSVSVSTLSIVTSYTIQQTSTSVLTTFLTSFTTVTLNSTAQASFPFVYPMFLTAYCFGGGTSGNGTWYPEPCFIQNDFSEVYVFDCGNSSASESGCTQVVTSTLTPQANYTINIRFPYVAQANEPAWANCFYSVKGSPEMQMQYAYCISVGQGSFILSQQGALPA